MKSCLVVIAPLMQAARPGEDCPVQQLVIVPASIHATINHPGEPTKRDDSADTMKIPDPIIEPTTIMVASIEPSDRVSPVRCSRPSLVIVMSCSRVRVVTADYGLRRLKSTHGK